MCSVPASCAETGTPAAGRAMPLSQGHDRQCLCPKGLTRWDRLCAARVFRGDGHEGGQGTLSPCRCHHHLHLPPRRIVDSGENRAAQFRAVCRSSILAEALCLSALFAGQPRQKRSVSERRTSLRIDLLQLYTTTDTLSAIQTLEPTDYAASLCYDGMLSEVLLVHNPEGVGHAHRGSQCRHFNR